MWAGADLLIQPDQRSVYLERSAASVGGWQEFYSCNLDMTALLSPTYTLSRMSTTERITNSNLSDYLLKPLKMIISPFPQIAVFCFPTLLKLLPVNKFHCIPLFFLPVLQVSPLAFSIYNSKGIAQVFCIISSGLSDFRSCSLQISQQHKYTLDKKGFDCSITHHS